MSLLTFDDGIIKLDGELLPGILSSQKVTASVRFDEQEIDGLTSKKKVPMGWSDADITISMQLTTDESDGGADCYEKLASLDKIFRSKSKGKVRVFDVANRHLMARGVRQVVFSNLESSESNQDDVISVTLQFVEYEPPAVKSEQAAAVPAGQIDDMPAANKDTPPLDETIIDVDLN